MFYRLANFCNIMDDEKYKPLLEAIHDSKHEVGQKVTASIEELKQEVTEGQERSLLELAIKINKSTYQFCCKGNEAHQFVCGRLQREKKSRK